MACFCFGRAGYGIFAGVLKDLRVLGVWGFRVWGVGVQGVGVLGFRGFGF